MTDTKQVNSSAETALSLEQIVGRLEAITRELAEGKPQLEQSLTLFEEGVRLSKHGTKKLNEAEAALEVLLAGDGRGRLNCWKNHLRSSMDMWKYAPARPMQASE